MARDGGTMETKFRLVSLVPTRADIPFSEGDVISIGRAPTATVCVSDNQFISSVHVNIVSRGGDDVFLVDLSRNGTWTGATRAALTKVGHKNRRALVHGCIVNLIDPTSSVTAPEKNLCYRFECREDPEDTKKDTARWGAVAEEYSIGRQLGKGTFATVYHAKRRKNRAEEAAVKIIDKQKLAMDPDSQETARLLEEVHLLQRIDHPNVVKIHGVFDDAKALCIVLEYVRAGDLFDYTVNSKFSEDEARLLFLQLLEALLYLHSQRVVHRDLKPANVLVDAPAAFALPPTPPGQSGYGKAQLPVERVELKLTDFGIAKWTGERQTMQTFCGTPIFIAPEVQARRSYNQKVDMWSVGVILYVLITGVLPKNPHTGVAFPAKHWDGVSNAAKGIVAALLCVDPARRLSLYETCQHKWMDCLEIKGRDLAPPPAPPRSSSASRSVSNSPQSAGDTTAENSPLATTVENAGGAIPSFCDSTASSEGKLLLTNCVVATSPMDSASAPPPAAGADAARKRAAGTPAENDPPAKRARLGNGAPPPLPVAMPPPPTDAGEDAAPLPDDDVSLGTAPASPSAAGDAEAKPKRPKAARWFWKSYLKGPDASESSWTEYGPAECKKIEAAFKKKQKTAKVNESYRIDFQAMVQVQVTNSTRKRAVRRVPA
eukprot:TRINITY_DN387_c1_g1_i1.p1 TRINITY_DN387_c1_g1~~TRINITY_DN387_c1_g1_i1.p1  ORF type:complete len:659 (+),score=217.24 TRINITY_DN387_c1_g1_i1:75-2051(+)